MNTATTLSPTFTSNPTPTPLALAILATMTFSQIVETHSESITTDELLDLAQPLMRADAPLTPLGLSGLMVELGLELYDVLDGDAITHHIIYDLPQHTLHPLHTGGYELRTPSGSHVVQRVAQLIALLS